MQLFGMPCLKLSRRSFLAAATGIAITPFLKKVSFAKMSVLNYRFVSSAPAKGYLQNGWVSWMDTQAFQSFTRFKCPGILDPNHLDGVGALRLLAHMPTTTGPGSPGALNLNGGKIRIKARLSDDFDANGNSLRLWLCKNLPGDTLNPVRQTNWMLASFNFLDHLSSEDFAIAECVVPSGPVEWQYAGVNATWQSEIVASRYAETPVGDTISDVSATLHICFVGPRADDPPQGHVDIEHIEIETASMPTPPQTLASAQTLVSSSPITALMAMGAVARTGNVTAKRLYGKWLANGVVGATLVSQDTKTAVEMLGPIIASDYVAAWEYAKLRAAGDGAPRDQVAAYNAVDLHPTDPNCRALRGTFRMSGIGTAGDQANGHSDLMWAAERVRDGLPQVAAMATVGRNHLIGRGTYPSDAQAYIWLARCNKFASGYLSSPATAIMQENLAVARARMVTQSPSAPGELDSTYVNTWSPTAV